MGLRLSGICHHPPGRCGAILGLLYPRAGRSGGEVRRRDRSRRLEMLLECLGAALGVGTARTFAALPVSLVM